MWSGHLTLPLPHETCLKSSLLGHQGALGRYFARVEHRDTEAYTLWESRENLQAFLDAFIELMGPTVAPEGPYPFRVTRRNRVYIAEKAFSPTPTG